MLEKVRETREVVFDLYFNFYDSGSPETSVVQREVTFPIVAHPDKIKILPETMRLDFDNDWAGDKPGFIVLAGERRNFRIYPKTGFYESEYHPGFISKQKELAGPNAQEWFYFSRVLIEIDSEFEWDFDDESNMANYDEEILDPIFQCFRPQFGDLRVISYFVDPYEIN